MGEIVEDPQLVQMTPGTSVYRQLYAKMQTLYRTCMDVNQVNREGLAPMQRQITELLDLFQPNKSSLTHQTAFMYAGGFSNVVDMWVEPDDADPLRWAIGLYQPTLTLPAVENYQDEEMVKEYTALMAEFFKLVLGGMDAGIQRRILGSGQTWQGMARDVVALETKLAAISEKTYGVHVLILNFTLICLQIGNTSPIPRI